MSQIPVTSRKQYYSPRITNRNAFVLDIMDIEIYLNDNQKVTTNSSDLFNQLWEIGEPDNVYY
jgi:hypothetical protein